MIFQSKIYFKIQNSHTKQSAVEKYTSISITYTVREATAYIMMKNNTILPIILADFGINIEKSELFNISLPLDQF